jgi:hypothetical protein
VSFRARLAAVCAALALLAGLFLLGLLLPQEGREARAEEAPLLPLSSSAELSAMEIHPGEARQGGRPEAAGGRRAALELRRTDGGWQAREGGRVWLASSERAEALAALLAGLRRGRLVSSDPARRGELGLEGGAALVLRRGEGQPELRLRVGGRAPGGQEDYLSLEGRPEVYLARGNLSVLLAQDRAYWLNLYVFPDEVRGETIARVVVRGAVPSGEGEPPVRGGYALARSGEGWTLDGRPADATAAQAMADALARLEGEDLLEAEEAPGTAGPGAGGAAAAAAGGLEAAVTTLDGRNYAIRVTREAGELLLRLSGSPWVYPLNPRMLARAILPAEALRRP